jgi:hypothetical protein
LIRKGLILKQRNEEFKKIIDIAGNKLKTISETNSSKKSAPNKWSSKEILGHLIDSSINNIARFINGQFQEDLIFNGYDQNKWVEAQDYQSEKWEFIINLWKINNLQIIHVLEAIPNNILIRTFAKHNYDLIAWKEIPREEQTNLEYLVVDYFGHMKHHLNQIFRNNSIEEIQ